MRNSERNMLRLVFAFLSLALFSPQLIHADENAFPAKDASLSEIITFIEQSSTNQSSNVITYIEGNKLLAPNDAPSSQQLLLQTAIAKAYRFEGKIDPALSAIENALGLAIKPGVSIDSHAKALFSKQASKQGFEDFIVAASLLKAVLVKLES